MTSLFRSAAILAAIVLIPSAASAELRRVEFKLPGMDCAYCNGAMSAAVRKLDGVESVELLADKGAVAIRLKADNKITLQQLRRVIKSVGYEAKAADITARGRVVVAQGRSAFDLMNGSTLGIAGEARAATETIVEITGLANPGPQDDEVVTIATIR